MTHQWQFLKFCLCSWKSLKPSSVLEPPCFSVHDTQIWVCDHCPNTDTILCVHCTPTIDGVPCTQSKACGMHTWTIVVRHTFIIKSNHDCNNDIQHNPNITKSPEKWLANRKWSTIHNGPKETKQKNQAKKSHYLKLDTLSPPVTNKGNNTKKKGEKCMYEVWTMVQLNIV